MRQAYSIESDIRRQLAQVGTCSLDELVALLPGYSWAQVFSAVDRLTREGTLSLTRRTPFQYFLSLAPRRSFETGDLASVRKLGEHREAGFSVRS